MASRKSLSKKVRFEIFKRDGFCCQYCGAKPPKIPLEVDHILPVSKGGGNEDYNLITSCFDCNRGKSNKELSISPISTIKKAEKMKIAQLQYKEIQKLLKKEKEIIESQIQEVEDVLNRFYEDKCFSDKFRVSVKTFLLKLEVSEVCDSMEKACCKMRNIRDVIPYFCGICWNKIKERADERI